MKKILTILTCLLAASQLIYSQTCENISPYKEGMSLEYTNFNKKGKAKSIENHFIESVTNENGSLTIRITSTEKKDKNSTKNYTLKCINGNFYVDMSNYTTLQNDNKNGSLQVTATGDFLEFTDEMIVGTTLDDGKIDLKFGDQNSLTSFATMEVNNRKVLENNSFTIKAGTFEGYKISFDYVFNLGIIKFKGSGIEWYVKGIGIVKTENYSKKGKLRGTRELTKISS